MTQPVIVGIGGGSGSGKSTLVRALLDELGDDVLVIDHDSYYRDRASVPPTQRQNINYDHPDALETELLVAHLDSLIQGCPVEVPIYDFAAHLRRSETRRVEPRQVIIVEGILVLADRSLRERMQLRIFVQTDDDVRLIRRLQRDVRERGRTMDSVIDQYLRTVKPMHHEFVEPSKRHAHLIIPDGAHDRTAVDVLTAKIKAAIASQAPFT